MCRRKYNKTSLDRAHKWKILCVDCGGVSRNHTCQSVHVDHKESETCFCCGQTAGKDSLHRASTFELDEHTRKSVLKLEDKSLLVKLSAENVKEQDIMYHMKCLATLYKKARETRVIKMIS